MRCPSCGYQESKVVDSRSADDGASYPAPSRMPAVRHAIHHLRAARRKSHSRHQGRRFIGGLQPREAHARIAHCLRETSHHAREDRRTHHEHRGGIAIESAQRDQIARFGRFGTGRLATLDDVAYIRFASVYKDFQNVEEFSEALKELG